MTMLNVDMEKLTGFNTIVSEIQREPGARIIDVRDDDYMYIKFLYKGLMYYVEPCPNYPFTDDNHPALYNYMVYKIANLNTKRQITYYKPWNGISALDEYKKELKPVYATANQPIDYRCSSYEKIVSAVVGRMGTQKQIKSLKHAVLLKTVVWTGASNIIQVIDSRDDTYFCVDIVRKEIV